MPSTKKRPQSPTNDEPPHERPKTTTQAQTQAQTVPPKTPKRRSRGPKDQRLVALKKLNAMRRSNIFKSKPRQTDAVQPTTTTTTGVGHAIATAQSPNLSPILSRSPPSLPINEDSFAFDESNNTPGSPGGASRTTPPSNIRNNLCQTNHPDAAASTWNTRRNSQATQWKSVVIPQLIPVYLANHAETKSGRISPSPKPPHLCQCNVLALKVELMTWDCTYSFCYMGRSLTYLSSGCSQQTLSICECYPASVQLVEMGYFPCAPVRPTLTFDINLLEFVTIASHHMAPNVMGWSSSLQEFLSLRGYLLSKKVRGTVGTVNSNIS